MKKYASALAIAGLLAAPAAHSAAAVDFNGEFEVNAYSLNLDRPGDDTRALQQLLRLGANIKLDDGVQVVTRMNLANNTWLGDTRATGGGTFSPDAGDSVTLDLGYLQLPLGPGVLRVGRQESNWANCFVSCDDRRDRILYASRLGTTSVGLIYDKRKEDQLAVDDDTSGYGAYAVGKVGPALAGLLLYHTRNDDALSTVLPAPTGRVGLPGADGSSTVISPYFQAKLAGVELSGAAAYVLMDYDDFTTAGGLGPVIEFDDTWGLYLRAGFDLGVAKVEGQAIYSDGFGVNQGFDTFSSMINNSSENNLSPTSVTNLTGDFASDFGTGTTNVGDNAMLLSLRVIGNVTNQVKLIGAAGWGNREYTNVGLFTGATAARDDDLWFADLQAHYQATKSTLIWATAGRVNVSPDVGDKRDIDAFSLNVRTSF